MDAHEFEDEVRRIARELWPSAEFGGAALEDGRERDGIFITEDMVHLIEATTSRKKEKAENDVKKLETLAAEMRRRYQTRGVKGWFVTMNEPTADQKSVAGATRNVVVAVSFDQFRSKLINARGYLDARDKHPFGSVRDPDTNSANDRTNFIPIGMISIQNEASVSYTELRSSILAGDSAVLLGDFGAGKSMTSRQLYRDIAIDFKSGRSRRFPVFLNLREHFGQSSPAEAIERHCRNIGFPNPSHLVRAWKAGYVILVLDGFDEVATSGWVGPSHRMKEIRYRAMELIRNFNVECPDNTPIVISGRLHYFNGVADLKKALGIFDSGSRKFSLLSLSEFSDEQIRTYLIARGVTDSVPAWLPSRPLLLSYLASRDLLKKLIEDNEAATPAEGWDSLLFRIADRESENLRSGLDGETIRLIIEKLATRARVTANGLGPLQPADLLETYREVYGAEADEGGMVLLQRLPGLGIENPETESRAFIDSDFAEAARAGVISRFIQNPMQFDLPSASSWQSCLTPLGIDVIALQCERLGVNAGKLTTACRISSNKGWNMAGVDIALAAHVMNSQLTEDVAFSEALIPEIRLDMSSGTLENVSIRDSIINRLDLDFPLNSEFIPLFSGCDIGEILGRSGYKDLPPEKFRDCKVETFLNSTDTNSAILGLRLAVGTKVLLTVLKKLYSQSGSGRKESALLRGLDPSHRALVPQVLKLLRSEELAFRAKTSRDVIWLPVRSQAGRIHSILESPVASTDPILAESGLIR